MGWFIIAIIWFLHLDGAQAQYYEQFTVEAINQFNNFPNISKDCGSKKNIQSNEYINDTLVTNLSCKNLTEKNILTFIDLNKVNARLDVIGNTLNNFASGLTPGQCWALARTYRYLAYLTPTDSLPSPTANNKEEALKIAFDFDWEISSFTSEY